MFWDYTYFLVIFAAVICGIASLNVKRTYKKYSTVGNHGGLTGRDAAEKILRNAGIYEVSVERISGSLTDHYSPKEKVLRLSEEVYDSTSVAAIGVAAHECGHAIQDKESYLPLKLRSASVPMANIGSKISWPLFLIGLIFQLTELAHIGVILFAVVVFFQFITLPVEFNASRRALRILENNTVLYSSELAGARKVLTAAALTYVAALFASIMQLVRMILLTRGGRRRRR